MAESGDWIVPKLMGQPHLTKPPLTYWLTALALRAFGTNAWAVRLPTALAFLVTVLVTADLGRRLWNPAAGFWAGAALLTCALPLAASGILTTDTLLSLFETGAVWCAWRSVTHSVPAQGRWWALGFHLALGLAFLTKGPPGLLTAAALLPFALRHRRSCSFLRLLHPGGLAVFFFLAVPWYVAVAFSLPSTLGAWWKTELVGRVFGESHRNMPASLYFPILLGGALPIGFFLPWALRLFIREIRERGPGALPAELLLCWITIPLSVLCAAKSRLPLYLLPLFPPLALMLGFWLAKRLEPRASIPRWAMAAVVVMGTLLATGRSVAGRVPGILMPDPRPIARSILDDGGTTDKAREVFLTSSFSRVPACGLAFYLRQPVERVELNPAGGNPGHGPRFRSLHEVLEEPPGPGRAQYFAVRPENACTFEAAEQGLCSGRWILREGGLWIWRRGEP